MAISESAQQYAMYPHLHDSTKVEAKKRISIERIVHYGRGRWHSLAIRDWIGQNGQAACSMRTAREGYRGF